MKLLYFAASIALLLPVSVCAPSGFLSVSIPMHLEVFSPSCEDLPVFSRSLVVFSVARVLLNVLFLNESLHPGHAVQHPCALSQPSDGVLVLPFCLVQLFFLHHGFPVL